MYKLFRIVMWVFVFLVCVVLSLNFVFFSTEMPKVELNPLKPGLALNSLTNLSKTFQNELSGILNLNDRNGLREVLVGAEEINTLFNLYLAGNQIVENKDERVKITNIAFKDGVVFVNLTCICKFSTPFGRYVNVRAGIIPQIDKNVLRVNVKYVKIGRFELTSPNVVFSRYKNQLGLDQTAQKVLDAIEKLQVRKDELLILYYPVRLQNLVFRPL